MNTQQYVLAHKDDALCGVTVIRSARRVRPLVVISELPDNPGISVEDSGFVSAARRVSRVFLHGRPLSDTDWVYHSAPNGCDRLVQVCLDFCGEILDFRYHPHGLTRLLEEDSTAHSEISSVPAFRPLAAIMTAAPPPSPFRGSFYGLT